MRPFGAFVFCPDNKNGDDKSQAIEAYTAALRSNIPFAAPHPLRRINVCCDGIFVICQERIQSFWTQIVQYDTGLSHVSNQNHQELAMRKSQAHLISLAA